MIRPDPRAHWDNAYATKGEAGVSWFEDTPAVSLELIGGWAGDSKQDLIDIGGGASRLVDALLEDGFHDVAVLDVSAAALNAAKARLGDVAASVDWICTDVTRWQPVRTYHVWHDRAAFHFLTEAADRKAYVGCMAAAVESRGIAIIATFALDGPERCSGLQVVRYDPAMLVGVFKEHFELVDHRQHLHTTPWGSTQSFQYCVFRRNKKHSEVMVRPKTPTSAHRSG